MANQPLSCSFFLIIWIILILKSNINCFPELSIQRIIFRDTCLEEDIPLLFRVNGYRELSHSLHRRYKVYNKIVLNSMKDIQYVTTPRIQNSTIALMYISNPEETDIRLSIRNYLKAIGIDVNVYFTVMKKSSLSYTIINESLIFNDILYLNVNNAYKNLSLATMAGYNYFSKYNSYFSYLLRSDTDCVINFTKIANLIDTLSPNEKYIGSGYTKRFGNNFTRYWNTGGGVLIKSNALPELMIAFRYVNFHYAEDWFTGDAFQLLNIYPTKIDNWILYNYNQNIHKDLPYYVIHISKNAHQALRLYNQRFL